MFSLFAFDPSDLILNPVVTEVDNFLLEGILLFDNISGVIEHKRVLAAARYL